MKLVTGIEAIQSGKPFKLVPDTDWTLPDSIIGQVTPKELLEKIWVIKEEPREFCLWMEGKSFIRCTEDTPPVDQRVGHITYIRVREIEK